MRNSIELDIGKINFDVLKDTIGKSRVVALGECAHFVPEFWELRQYLFKYLHENAGFNVFAMEFGFAESYKLKKWIDGEGNIDRLSEYSEAAAKWGALSTMRWLRNYNKISKNRIRFVGIDIPEAGGTIIPALLPLQEYIRKVDDSLDSKLFEIIEIANKFSALSSLKSIKKWISIPLMEQYKLYAELNKLRLRLMAMENKYVQLSDQEKYDIALRLLETAITTVYIICTHSAPALPLDMSIREKFMADSILWHLNHSDLDTKIVVFAHNNHIQKTLVQYGDYKVCYPMGFYLNKYLGQDYTAFGLTTTDNHIPDMDLTDTSPVGFKVVDKKIGLPVNGSFENFLIRNGYSDHISFKNLENIEEKIACFRSQSAYIHTPSIGSSFNGIFSIPKISIDPTIGF